MNFNQYKVTIQTDDPSLTDMQRLELKLDIIHAQLITIAMEFYKSSGMDRAQALEISTEAMRVGAKHFADGLKKGINNEL